MEKKQAAGEEETMTSHHDSSNSGRTSDDEDDHKTLAQLLIAPSTPARKSATFSSNISELKRERLLRVNNARFASKSRNDTSSKQAQRRVKSMSTLSDSVSRSAEHTRPMTMIRAEELQSNLDSAFPSFVKTMLRSHVSSCFWLGLPWQFCKRYMPEVDSMFTLRDQDGHLHEVKFLSEKPGLSGGWISFSTKHNILVDDVLVFHLIEPLVFKVYVIRAKDTIKIRRPLTLLDSDDQGKSTGVSLGMICASQKCDVGNKYDAEAGPSSSKVAKKSRRKSLNRPVHKLTKSTEENNGNNMSIIVVPEYCSTVRDPSPQIHNNVNLENLKISVDEFLIDLDPTLSEDIRMKYQELCCSQNSLLHDNLLEGLNFKLISGIIYETVRIADAIRGLTLTTSQDTFVDYDRTLKAFEDLGMNVSFLRARLNLAYESEAAVYFKQYVEAQIRKVHTEEEIKTLAEKILELKSVSERFDSNMKALELEIEKHELNFNKKVIAPW